MTTREYPVDQAAARTIVIPAREDHAGIHSMIITVPWVCLHCGGRRGDPFETVSHHGSRRLHCHAWKNACGHRESFGLVREHAALHGTSA